MEPQTIPHGTSTAQKAGPLHGVRVVDTSRLVAGNQLTVLLADLGADVIKVEQPGRGDPLRDWKVKGVSLNWKVYGRGKRSITLNLKDPRAREILLKLLETASIFVENFKPGTLEQMGLGPATLLGRNPRLVIVRLSGWGQTGPYAPKPGFGTLVEAMSGFAAMNGFEDREPLLPPLSLADMVAGTYGAMATLAALRHVEVEGGGGQVVDLSLLEPLLSILGPLAASFQLTGEVPKRVGSRSNTTAPRNVYRTKDGRWMALSASTQVMTERLFRALDCAELISDPRFRTNSDRVAHVEELDAILQARFSERTLEENLRELQAAGVSVAPVYDIRDLLGDAHIRERGVVVEVADLDGGEDPGSVLMHAVVPRFSRTPGSIAWPGPDLGRHNEEVLTEVGLRPDELEQLASEQVI
ncbi:CaiB/BaiF CoA transferase family protein [Limnochorda pilosa]|uniref:Acyl-CoA transferase n=1 Tax=Limnochorda pilosa TaxID=1555112 RepID=A0A0K2SN85_LIMPI|nr:CoA transferase [Limnochorda pilosa]BAS28593.1 acyl-CoA transferase [Limnochorda pilosa]